MSSSPKVVSEPKYFELVDFEKVCPLQNFMLPPEILTLEVLAKKSTKAGIKAKAVRTSSRVPKPKKSEEVDNEDFKRRKSLKFDQIDNIRDPTRTRKANYGSNSNTYVISNVEGSLASAVAQHRSVKRTYTDNADSAATLAWKAPNFPRKKKKTIHLNEQQIRALPEQPNLFANYNGRAFIENPFMRQSTPSVLIQGAYKLNAEHIKRSFIQTCFRGKTDFQVEEVSENADKDDMEIDEKSQTSRE
ncbi:7777_t:CDS:2 [Funneliformis geosporum]|uniref:10385_t:CDS:1 n=1 Tax=Funneliformis geosporum TaxID=1117311 RepID=A0A9W4WX23_9GLOM|nr:7777_t:CDS:2 [Funneliformis geosporum]CAI2169956.1 10385_t:CDS:2 [Funneliformis geosporum]